MTRTERQLRSRELVRPSDLNSRRKMVTLVAFVCDKACVQKALPQVVIGNHTVLPRRLAAAQRARNDAVFVVSRKSSWVNAEALCEIFSLLAASLSPWKDRYCPVLSMDCCPVHCVRRVLRHCWKVGLRVHFIPACMTAQMQPLDTHVFASLKRELVQAYHAAIVESEIGQLLPERALADVCAVIATVLAKDWSRAFASAGFSENQQGVSPRLLASLSLREVPAVSADLPSLEELQPVWKRRSEIPVQELFELWFAPLRTRAKTPKTCPDPEDLSESPDLPLRLRLRSSSQLRLQPAPGPVAASASVEVNPPSPQPCPPPSVAALARVPTATKWPPQPWKAPSR